MPEVRDLVYRDFIATRPNQRRATDITEHTTKERQVFYCVVFDAFARKAIGKAISRTCTRIRFP